MRRLVHPVSRTGGVPRVVTEMAKTKTDLLRDARAQVPEVSALDLAAQLRGPQRPVVLDVREKDESDAGLIPGAKVVPRGFLELRVEEAVPDRTADVVLYCGGGTRSLLAARSLKEMGYERVRSLQGGFAAWAQAGQPVDKPVRLSAEQALRVSTVEGAEPDASRVAERHVEVVVGH